MSTVGPIDGKTIQVVKTQTGQVIIIDPPLEVEVKRRKTNRGKKVRIEVNADTVVR